MRETTANEFRKTLKKKVDTCILDHEVLKVTRKHGGDFVIIGESDWRAIEETLYLNRIPGLVESVHQAAAEDYSQGTLLHDIEW